MSKATEKARKLLEAVEDDFPVRLNEMTLPKDDDVIGTLRKPDGYPIIAPHPESTSMLVGKRAVFDFITEAYGVIESLLAELDKNPRNQAESTQNSA